MLILKASFEIWLVAFEMCKGNVFVCASVLMLYIHDPFCVTSLKGVIYWRTL